MQCIEEAGIRFVEGPAGQPLMRAVKDATLVVEACFSAKVACAILYPENFTEKFFDLGSGEAGEILQKLRNYRIRTVVVCQPGSVKFSSRFMEMAEEETRGKHFGVVDSGQAAQAWLS